MRCGEEGREERKREREGGREERKEAGGGGLNEEGQGMTQDNSGKPSTKQSAHHTPGEILLWVPANDRPSDCSGEGGVENVSLLSWAVVTHRSPLCPLFLGPSVFPSDCVDRMKGCLLLTQQNVAQCLGVSPA